MRWNVFPMKLVCTLSLFFCYLFLHYLFASCLEKQVYVVYFGRHEGNKTLHEREEMHHSCLLSVKKSKEEAKASLIYSYKHHINGFAALLTPNEASKLSELERVVSVSESFPTEYSTQTTRSWDFLGLEGLNSEILPSQLSLGRDMLIKAKYGENIIVGILDSGIWPEFISFGDEEIREPPSSWKEGKCQTGQDFHDGNCNRKIIGAKYYHGAFERYHGVPIHPLNSKSPRDFNGHGTHIASIVSGRTIRNVDALGGFAFGRASGGAPMSYLAIYKVCWQVSRQGHQFNDCLLADVLQGIDAAISDGVHVMSISIGKPIRMIHDNDLIANAALLAIKENILVVGCAGVNGPKLETVSNIAPWILTTGSGSIDRMFIAFLRLSNDTTLKIKGQSITPYETTNMYPLVYAGEAQNPDFGGSGHCNTGSLSPEKVRGKLVLCGNVMRSQAETSAEVLRAGGVGIVIGDVDHMGANIPLFPHRIPSIILTTSQTIEVYKYIKRNQNPMASFERARTVIREEAAPSLATFSSKGPSIIDRHILKPDRIAPDLNILAAWTEASSPNVFISDHRVVKYNINSGSSIAAAHVTAVIALLKAIYPKWSAAALKSATMTSASITNDIDSLIKDYDDDTQATPFSYGSAHLTPTKAVDPGLVYDTSFTDYLTYLCGLGKKVVAQSLDDTFVCPQVSVPSYNLNYPTIAISYNNQPVKIQRTVTNVGNEKSVYLFEAVSPEGFLVEATPKTLNFDHVDQKISFTITVSQKETKINSRKSDYAFGYYVWKDNSHYVRSFIVLYLK